MLFLYAMRFIILITAFILLIPKCQNHLSAHSFKSLIDWKFHSRSTSPNFFSTEPLSQILLLSLIDGTLLALDIETGNLLWSINEDDTSFLSLTTNTSDSDKSLFTFVPSSTGQIYKLNKEMIELVRHDDKGRLHFDNKLLITSSRQDTITIGVDITTGKLFYYCSPTYCFKNSTVSVSNNENLLVIQRTLTITQVINVTTGDEYLKFVSGKHELLTLSTISDRSNEKFKEQPKMNKLFDNEGLHYDINTNTIYGYGKTTLSGECSVACKMGCWNFQLPCPVLSSWLAQQTPNGGYSINKIRLASLMSIHIDGKYVLNEYKMAFANKSDYKDTVTEKCQEIMFLNVYNNFPFLQNIDENSKIDPNCDYAKIFTYNRYRSDSFDENSIDLTQSGLSSHELTDAVEKITNVRHKIYHHSIQNSNVDSLKLRAGWKPVSLRKFSKRNSLQKSKNSFFSDDFILFMPFLAFWREIIYVIFIVYLIILFIIRAFQLIYKGNQYLTKFMSKSYLIQDKISIRRCSENIIIKNEIDDEQDLVLQMNEASSPPPISSSSRYATDFQHIGVLGTGGFGVVFKAKNIVDDCVYAIKRVALPDCINSREKVMREVKALAKLNHKGIVRFYNAWFEFAPDINKDAAVKGCYRVENDATDDNCISPLSEKMPEYDDGDHEKSNSHFMYPPTTLPPKSDDLPVNDDDDDDNSIEFVSDDKEIQDSKPLWEDAEPSSSSLSSGAESTNDVLVVKNRSTSFFVSCDSSSNKCFHERKIYLYIQMQLCHKHTLRSWLTKNQYDRDLNFCISIFSQVLSAVEYVHSLKLMHRDLKPSNIFFSLSDGSVKIGDFGLVTMISTSPQSSPEDYDYPANNNPSMFEKTNEENLTQMVGTELYMSPEQLQHHPYNQKIDIYSLGLILFELLVPFTTQYERQLLITSAKKGKFPEKLNLLPKDFSELLGWMLQISPNKRPSATEIIGSEIFKNILNYTDNKIA